MYYVYLQLFYIIALSGYRSLCWCELLFLEPHAPASKRNTRTMSNRRSSQSAALFNQLGLLDQLEII